MLDLESKLAKAQELGIQATKEVQLAARQVVLENGRLRELLRLVGFADEDIDTWAVCRENGDRTSCDRQLEIAQRAGRVGTFSQPQKEETKKTATPHLDEDASGKETRTTGSVSESGDRTSHHTVELVGNKPYSPDPSDSRAAGRVRGATAASEDASTPKVESRACRGEEVLPCKLLTRLAENPATDVTLVPAPPGSGELLQDAACHGDIECRKAYDMLIAHAASEEKMDYVARALEGGCTANGSGGCGVKSKVILQALDHLFG